jgi:hypothetical protein
MTYLDSMGVNALIRGRLSMYALCHSTSRLPAYVCMSVDVSTPGAPLVGHDVEELEGALVALHVGDVGRDHVGHVGPLLVGRRRRRIPDAAAGQSTVSAVPAFKLDISRAISHSKGSSCFRLSHVGGYLRLEEASATQQLKQARRRRPATDDAPPTSAGCDRAG